MSYTESPLDPISNVSWESLGRPIVQITSGPGRIVVPDGSLPAPFVIETLDAGHPSGDYTAFTIFFGSETKGWDPDADPSAYNDATYTGRDSGAVFRPADYAGTLLTSSTTSPPGSNTKWWIGGSSSSIGIPDPADTPQRTVYPYNTRNAFNRFAFDTWQIVWFVNTGIGGVAPGFTHLEELDVEF